MDHTHAACHEKPRSHLRNPLLWVTSGTAILLLLSLYIPVLAAFRENFWSYTKAIWWAILLGFFIGGLIHQYIPASYTSAHLAGHRKRTIGYAVVLGFLMSACSHGMLAIAIQLYKKGASTASVISFLLASPWANLPVMILFFGLFGFNTAYILGGAFIVALITGMIFIELQKKGLVESNPHTLESNPDFSVRKDIKRRWKERVWTAASIKADIRGILAGTWSLTQMVLWWILIGMVLASLAGAYVPTHFFHDYMGPELLGLLITLGAATIIEICSEGSAPLAFELYRQTGAIGNSFVFLMAGVVTDYTEIGLLWKNIGRRTAMWLVAVTVPQTIVLGWLMNKFIL